MGPNKNYIKPERRESCRGKNDGNQLFTYGREFQRLHVIGGSALDKNGMK